LDDVNTSINKTSENFRFAAAVAAFGMLLRDSKYKGNINFNYVHELANKAIGKDEEGYRKEFVTLIEKAAKLKGDVGLRK
jgi:Ca-activated chloride channel family protein